MGGCRSRLPRLRMLVLGLDSAGKTTTIHCLTHGKPPATTMPTMDMQLANFERNGIKFSIWDVGGQEMLRPQWRNQYSNTDGVLFVIDATDGLRVELAKAELHSLLRETTLKGISIAVLANKSDSPGAATPEELGSLLELEKIRAHGHQCEMFGTSAKTASGFDEVFEWVSAQCSDPQFGSSEE
eukprot:TRINITY_DN11583_c0_g1_i1.p1 TRINITY_DN11583_c0_g1~~TRINITY_DN11583_c0_g1_i1.p1  ORF type:complete len:184 (+),score=42.87 TRINITY_DN11583_c0_g1_i1:235-786(+)